MALTRNQRRKMARERQLAKAVRVSNAIETRERDARNAIVAANLNSPRPPRNYYKGIRSCLDGMETMSHKGLAANPGSSVRLECRAGGSMPRGRALALKAKGSW